MDSQNRKKPKARNQSHNFAKNQDSNQKSTDENNHNTPWAEAARQTLDLWQQHLSSHLADPFWVDQWGHFLANLQQTHDQAKKTSDNQSSSSPAAKAANHDQPSAKSKAAVLSSEQRLAVVDELVGQLQRLTKRVDMLEQQLAKIIIVQHPTRRTSKKTG